MSEPLYSRLTPEELDHLDEVYAEDPIAFMEDCLMIQPKEGGLVPFRLNAGQKKLVAKLEEMRKAGVPIRAIVLKARQIGFSTVTQAYFVWMLTRNRFLSAVVLAHKSEASKNLFRMWVRFVEHTPPEFRANIKTKNEALGTLELGPEDPAFNDDAPYFGSRLTIESAENPNAGRSGTYQLAHASEYAFWPYPETSLSLNQAVPDKPGTVFVKESTANGAFGQFYDDWNNAVAGKTSYAPVFVSWWEHEDYTKPITPAEAEAWTTFRVAVDAAVHEGDDWRKHLQWRDDGTLRLDEDEVTLARLYPIDFGQIKWRRWCIPENCGGDADKFRQEFPSCPEEAFLMSGRPVFDSRTVIALKEQIRQAPMPERYTIDEVASQISGKPVLFLDPWGELTVWVRPQPDIKYAIGADVAEGTVDGDFNATHVVEVKTLQHCAELHDKTDPDIYGRKLHWLGIWYNQALIGVEMNAAGAATLQTLEKETMYPNLWGDGWPILSRIREYGWRTNLKTRKPMISRLKQAFREGSFQPRSLETLDEMLTMKVNEKGKEEAERGKHDDLVIAAAITLEMREQAANLVPFTFV